MLLCDCRFFSCRFSFWESLSPFPLFVVDGNTTQQKEEERTGPCAVREPSSSRCPALCLHTTTTPFCFSHSAVSTSFTDNLCTGSFSPTPALPGPQQVSGGILSCSGTSVTQSHFEEGNDKCNTTTNNQQNTMKWHRDSSR